MTDKADHIAWAAEAVAIFQEHFAELFSDTITIEGIAYPFLKRLKQVASRYDGRAVVSNKGRQLLRVRR